MECNKKVLLGLSGGVDSTAAALILKEQGYDVTGLFFDVLGTQKELAQRAEAAAAHLKIDFIYRDVTSVFDQRIIGYFCDSYLHGKTPNPCVLCNPTMKFKTLQEEADRIGAHYLATGHYARTLRSEEEGIVYVRKGQNEKKDQSYMLYRLPQEILSRLLLPLGNSEDKEQVRSRLREEGFSNAEAKDSQEICFVSEGSYIDFITRRGGQSLPGNFIDSNGNVMGQHQGIVHYTIGQRKGLGVTFGKPVFVTAIDPIQNTVTLGENTELFHTSVLAEDCCFAVSTENDTKLPPQYEGKRVMAKIRYAAKPASAILKSRKNGVVEAVFEEPQRAPTPGQSLVFYENDLCLGGGFIVSGEAINR